METQRMNTRSDELQRSTMTCIGCGKVYRSNVMAAWCEDCTDKKIEEGRQRLPVAGRRLGNQMVVDAGLPDTDE